MERRDLPGRLGNAPALLDRSGVGKGRGGSRAVLQGVHEAVKLPLLEVDQRARGHPASLLVGTEDVTAGVPAQTARSAQPAGDGLPAAVRRHLQAPTAPRVARGRLLAEARVERHPHVALEVELRTVGVLMVVAADAPTPGDGEVLVSLAVTVAVREAGQLGALHGVERPVPVGEAQRLVQAAREAPVPYTVRRLVVGVLDDPHLALANSHREAPVGEESKAADLELEALGDRQRDDPVVVVFDRWVGAGEPGAEHGENRHLYLYLSYHDQRVTISARPSSSSMRPSSSLPCIARRRRNRLAAG